MKCDLCIEKKCKQGEDCLQIKDHIQEIYKSPEDRKILKVSTAIEGNFYMQKTRIEELIIFCKEMSYKCLGVAFCVGLEEEAQIFCSLLRKYFTVYSVCCKVCGVAKDDFKLKKINNHGFSAICNPLIQARMLKEKDTELNINFGLCMGHDILFNNYSHAAVTTFIVKDRVLAHNPVGALYSRYYRKKINLKQEIEELNYENQ